MRLLLAASLLALSSASLAQTIPSIVTQPSKLDATWQAKTRALYETAVEIPTVSGRNQVPKLAEFLAGELKAAGFAADDIKIMPYEGETGDKTAALIARWRADKPTAKPILLMAHMDVVEAKREDWKFDPFEFREEGGYFYGRGSNDNKAGMTGLVMSFLKLKQAGWKPKRDLILFFTGEGALALQVETKSLRPSRNRRQKCRSKPRRNHNVRGFGFPTMAQLRQPR